MDERAATVLLELEALGAEKNRKVLRSHGAHDPIFGVTITAMKPITKRLGKDQSLAEALYATGNYDAMYLAGMIAEPNKMSQEDFERWIQGAYFYYIGDFIVSVTLAETEIAMQVADRWIASGVDLRMSAGWNCYSWLLGTRKDAYFNRDHLSAMLDLVTRTIHEQPNRTRYAMNSFVITVGVSYPPLHDEAMKAAKAIGEVDVSMGTTSCKTPLASEQIEKAIEKGRIGFKRKNVRC